MNIGKIIGLPVRVSSGKRVSIPREYLRFYGISVVHDMILIQMNECSMKISPPHEEVSDSSLIVTIQYGNFYLPSAWARKNKIQRGNYVFIIGTSDGLILYNKPDSSKPKRETK